MSFRVHRLLLLDMQGKAFCTSRPGHGENLLDSLGEVRAYMQMMLWSHPWRSLLATLSLCIPALHQQCSVCVFHAAALMHQVRLVMQAWATNLPLLRALPLCRVPRVCLCCLLVSALAHDSMGVLPCFPQVPRHGTLENV